MSENQHAPCFGGVGRGSSQPALFADPPRDPVRCPRCGWHGEGRELAQAEDEWGDEIEACPECGEESIVEGKK